jgi:hypothetical protein
MNGMRYQPQGAARLDRGNPLTRGISDVWIASAGATLAKNYPAGRSGANATADTVISAFGVAGQCIRGDGVTTGTGFSVAENANAILGSTDSTWFIVRRCRDTTVRNIFMHYGYENGAGSRCLLGAPEGSNITWDYGNATTGSGRLQAPYVKDTLIETLVVVAGQVKGREIWRRGVKIAGNPNAKASRSQDSRPFSIGRPEGGPAMDDVETYMFGVSTREWSDVEIVQWCRNPWQILDDGSADDFVAATAASYSLSVQPAEMTLATGQLGMRASRKLAVAPAALTLAASNVAMLASRRLGVLPAAMAVTGGQVVTRVSRRLSVTPAAMVMTGGPVSMPYAPKPEAGSYSLPVSAAAMTLTGRKVGMRIARRLRVEPASLLLVGGAVRILVRRRLTVSPAGLQLVGGSVTLRFSARGEPFDITKIHPSRIVIFEGSGSRVTPFEGSGSRVTSFGSTGTRKVRFE